MGGGSAIEKRIQEMEKRYQEQEASKKNLETQLGDLERQLKEEHEKVILQTLKAKEEETLSVRVEQQIREMQEKLRREKYEQELQESRQKAEHQLKDLERRLSEEREAWMVALRNQLKERESVERDVEHNLTRRLHDVESRFQDEKSQWSTAIRQKDEEIAELRRQMSVDMEKLKETVGDRDEMIDQLRENAIEQRRGMESQYQAELRAVQSQLDNQLRESGTWKAQMALLQTQIQQLESQRMDERARAQAQIQRLEQENREVRQRLEGQLRDHEDDSKRQLAEELRRHDTQALSREEEFKRDYARRDQERTQYWEGLVAQLRAEKESLRSTIIRREEDMAKTQMDSAEARRVLDVERAKFAQEADRIRRATLEEASRHLPETYQTRLEAERKKWEQTHLNVVQQLKAQLSQALESNKSLSAKLHVEKEHSQQTTDQFQAAEKARAELQKSNASLGQDMQALKHMRAALEQQLQALEEDRRAATNALTQEKSQWEKQTKEFLHRLAQAQMKESALREDMNKQAGTWASEQLARESQMQSMQEQIAAQTKDIEIWKERAATLEREMGPLRAEMRQMAEDQLTLKAREKEWEAAQVRMRETFNAVKAEVVQLQTERTQREAEWLEKQKAWEKMKDELEKAKTAAPSMILPLRDATASPAGAVPMGEEAVKAVTAIRQQMQEMQTLLLWLKPVKKPMGKAA